MLRRAGQTIGLKFFVDTHGLPGALEAKKSKIFFSKFVKQYFFSNFLKSLFYDFKSLFNNLISLFYHLKSLLHDYKSLLYDLKSLLYDNKPLLYGIKSLFNDTKISSLLLLIIQNLFFNLFYDTKALLFSVLCSGKSANQS